MAEHAKRILQPSSFKRTIGCPGWGQLCESLGIRPKTGNKYTYEGTAAHSLAEMCLRDNLAAASLLGGSIDFHSDGKNHRVKITEDMTEAVDVYLTEIRRKRVASVGAEYVVEKKLNMNWLIPGMFGTADHIIVEPLGKLYVDDYKHGQGVAVEVGDVPGDNVQTTLYALGAVGADNPYMVEEVCATIVQPRSAHSDGPVRSIIYDVDELYQWGYDVAVPAAKRAQEPDAPVTPGPWCKWCDANDPWDPQGVQCPAIREKAMELANVDFDKDLVPLAPMNSPAPPSTLTGEQLGRILRFADVLDDWIKVVRSEAFSRLETNSPDAPVGYKLVQGKLSNRAWAKSENEVVKDVLQLAPQVKKEQLFVTELKSPAQLEKVIKLTQGLPAKVAAALIEPLLSERSPGKPLMVPETDKRPAITSSVDTMFGPPIIEEA